jgi:hypothetical protein
VSRGIRAHEYVEDVGVEVAHRVLHAVEDPALPAPFGPGLESTHVRARGRLRDGEPDDLLARHELLEPALLLGLGEVAEELGAVGLTQARKYAVEVASRHLFGGDSHGDQVPLLLAALPEVRAEADDALDQLVGVALLAVCELVVGEQLTQCQLAQLRTKLLLSGGEGKVQHGLASR